MFVRVAFRSNRTKRYKIQSKQDETRRNWMVPDRTRLDRTEFKEPTLSALAAAWRAPKCGHVNVYKLRKELNSMLVTPVITMRKL